MSGGIVFKNSGPLGWLGKCQDRTSLSSCEAEIRAPIATTKKVVNLSNLSLSFTESGFWITDINQPTILYNNNDNCVRWCHNMTSKAARHIELCKNSVCEWVQDKKIAVWHVAGKINPANIFTKEMHDGTHFCCLHDSFMSRLLDFLNTTLLESHHARQRSQHSVAPSTAWVTLASGASSYLSALQLTPSVGVLHQCLICAVPADSFFGAFMVLSLLFSSDSTWCLLLCCLWSCLAFPLLVLALRLFSRVHLLRNPLGFAFFFQRCSFLMHGWGVSGLFVVLERRLS
jgi:hypothetical protein